MKPWIPLLVLALSVLFFAVSVAVEVSGGRGPLLRAKLRVGAWLLALTGVATTGCFKTTCYVPANEDSAPPEDTSCPVIDAGQVLGPVPIGEPIPIRATITDPGCGVFQAEVYYRQETSTTWMSVGLVQGDDGTYFGEIPGEDVVTAGVYYYIYAVDACENGCSLPESEDDAWYITIEG